MNSNQETKGGKGLRSANSPGQENLFPRIQ